MIRIILPIVFVNFLERIPSYAASYFIFLLALISIFVTVLGIKRGYLYYFDIINITIFSAILALWILLPHQSKSLIIDYRGKAIYSLLTIATIIPPLLALPAFRLVWKGDLTAIPAVFVVLWGTTFLLSAIMLWIGAPVRTPLLIITILTMPTRIAMARELNITKKRAWKPFRMSKE